jgi:hypothetical protein
LIIPRVFTQVSETADGSHVQEYSTEPLPRVPVVWFLDSAGSITQAELCHRAARFASETATIAAAINGLGTYLRNTFYLSAVSS